MWSTSHSCVLQAVIVLSLCYATARSKPTTVENSTPATVENSTPATVENSTPATVENSTPATVENSTPATVENSTPATVENSTPATVENSTPATVENSTPATVENSTPATVENSTPATVENSTPATVENSTPATVENSTPATVENSTPATVENSTPATVENSTPATVENSTPATVENSTPATVENSTPATVENSTPATVENSTPATVENSTPATVENSTPATVENSTPATVENSTPATVENSTPATVENSTPATVENSTPATVENSTPATVENSTPATVENSTPGTVENSTPGTVENSTPATVENSTPATVENSTPATVENSTPATVENSTPATVENSTPATVENSTPAPGGNSITDAGGNSTIASVEISTSSPAATSTRTKPPTTVSRPLPTAPRSISIKPNISFPFQIKYDNETFNKSLEDPRTDEYKQAVKKYTKKLLKAYENVTGFQDIIIHKFWNGSVGVDYSAVIAYNMTVEEFKDELERKVLPFLNQSGANQTFLRHAFDKSIKEALDVLEDACQTSSSFCHPDYLCMLDRDDRPICRPLCTNSEAISKCENGGKCVQDAPENFICRCPEDETFLYGGQFCEVKAEKLGLEKDYIIAIACGGGGGVILILIIVIVILSRRRRANKRSKDKDNASEQSFKSIKDSEDGLHQAPTGNRYAALLDYSNPAFRELEQRTENVRLHTRLSAGSGQALSADQVNVASNYGLSHLSQTRPVGQALEASKLAGSRSVLPVERKPSREQPSVYPNLQRIHPTADYVEIEDTYSKSIMYQPTRAMRPLTEFQQGRPLHSPTDARVFDYSSRVEPRGNQRGSQLGSGFQDFSYENSAERRRGVDDPYLIKRPQYAAQKRF